MRFSCFVGIRLRCEASSASFAVFLLRLHWQNRWVADFTSKNGDFRWDAETESDLIAFHGNHADFDVVCDSDPFIGFSGKHEHDALLC